MKKKLSPKILRVFLVIIIIIFLSILVGGGVMLAGPISEYWKGARAYNQLQQYLDYSSSSQDTHSNTTSDSEGGSNTENIVVPYVNFSALQTVNDEAAAWLICEDTVINYPVVQGTDNSYYLRHLLDGTWNNVGCLFIDCNNSPGFADHNTVIYGHNMSDKSMFASLMEYKNQDFYDEHPQMILLTPEGNYTIDLFAGYVTDLRSDSWTLNFSDYSSFEQWIQNAKEKSTFKSSVEVSTSDRFVTLSTCTYEFDNARYVVVGKLSPL